MKCLTIAPKSDFTTKHIFDRKFKFFASNIQMQFVSFLLNTPSIPIKQRIVNRVSYILLCRSNVAHIYIMNTKFFNHYPREWDTLGNEQKEIITGNVLSISQVSELSGFSKRFIYAQIHSMKLLSTDKDPLLKHINSRSLQIEWRRFLMWYSQFDILPASPFGPPTYSLKGMMKYMGRSSSWSLIFVSRYNIHTFFIGSLRRFNRYDVEGGSRLLFYH